MSKINLPPLPLEVESVYVEVDGLSTYREARDCYYTMDQMHAYAEQAVRPYVNALERIASEEFISLGEGNVDVRPVLSDREACNLARVTLMNAGSSGHKPAPVDTSTGHSDAIDTSPEYVEESSDPRQKFEEWASDKGFRLDCAFFEDGNNYTDSDTRLAFDIWNAALAANRKKPPC